MSSKSDSLQSVAHAQVNELYTVQSLLRAMITSVPIGADFDDEKRDDLDRLLRIANDRLDAVVMAFQPHI